MEAHAPTPDLSVGRSALTAALESARRRYATVAYPWLALVSLDYVLCCEVNFRRAPLTAVVTEREVSTAAARLFIAQQLELERRGEGFRPMQQNERTDLFKIWSHGYQAQRAAARRDGRAPRPGRAKRLQIEALVGRQPLTVCIGRLFRDGLGGYGEGCGQIFKDSRSRFARQCPGCLHNRKFARELDARRRAREWGRLAARRPDGSYLFFGLCACGRRFTTDAIHQTRCEPCRERHRGPPAGHVRTSAE
jgi:hypothetical protein